MIDDSFAFAIPIEDYHEVNYLMEKFRYINKKIKVYESNKIAYEEYDSYFAIVYLGKKPTAISEKRLIQIASLK